MFDASKNQKYPESSVSETAVPAPLVPSGLTQLALTWKRPPPRQRKPAPCWHAPVPAAAVTVWETGAAPGNRLGGGERGNGRQDDRKKIEAGNRATHRNLLRLRTTSYHFGRRFVRFSSPSHRHLNAGLNAGPKLAAPKPARRGPREARMDRETTEQAPEPPIVEDLATCVRCGTPYAACLRKGNMRVGLSATCPACGEHESDAVAAAVPVEKSRRTSEPASAQPQSGSAYQSPATNRWTFRILRPRSRSSPVAQSAAPSTMRLRESAALASRSTPSVPIAGRRRTRTRRIAAAIRPAPPRNRAGPMALPLQHPLPSGEGALPRGQEGRSGVEARSTDRRRHPH